VHSKARLYKEHRMLDNIKGLGFKYSTQGAITVSISDMTVPDKKKILIRETEAKV
jgi:DNA-directed RNA polymerase subunit beta'